MSTKPGAGQIAVRRIRYHDRAGHTSAISRVDFLAFSEEKASESPVRVGFMMELDWLLF